MSNNINKNTPDKSFEQCETRINKFLSEAGVCSRREADRLIEKGLVKIDGRTAVTGSKVNYRQTVEVNGKAVKREEKMVLIAVNKPVGIVCTAEKREKNNIVDFINYPTRIYPIGRLDKDSQGLILMTNNGAIVNEIMRARNMHEKEYIVEVDKPITKEFIDKMGRGVPILDTVTRECKVTRLSDRKFKIILTQGLNRQIRRMCEYLGYRVTRLERIRIMNIELRNLAEGGYRNVTAKELKELSVLTGHSIENTALKKDRKGKENRNGNKANKN